MTERRPTKPRATIAITCGLLIGQPALAQDQTASRAATQGIDSKTIMEIQWECTELNRLLFHYDDSLKEPGSVEKLVALFDEDAVLDTGRRVFRGAEEIKEWARQTINARPGDLVTRHVLPGLHFTHVDEATAQATVYLAIYVGHRSQQTEHVVSAAQMALQDLYMTYRKTGAGWRIASLKMGMTMKLDK